jgi:hypothetical protein
MRLGQLTRPHARSRRRGLILLSAAFALLGVAVAVSLIPVPGSSSQHPDYRFGTGPALTIIDAAVILSSIWFSIAAVDLWQRPVRAVLVAAFSSFVAWGALFALTLALSIPVKGSAGVAYYVQPYPQTVYALVWSLGALFGSFAAWFMSRALRLRSAALLDEESQVSARPRP